MSSSMLEEEVVVVVPLFPSEKLLKLEELISNPRWVIPVLPSGELEVLLESSIAHARLGRDVYSEDIQRFYREGLRVSFHKILTDDAVSSWKPDIQKCILRNCERLLELLVLKWSRQVDPEEEESFASHDLLVLLLNPHQKFHVFNSASQSERELAFTKENIHHKGWLCDLLELWGSLGGFEVLSSRLSSKEKPPGIPLLLALLRPFGLCAEFLHPSILLKVFAPLLSHIPDYLNSLNDEELKKEGKNDAISSLIKALKFLSASALSPEENEERTRELEMFRLQMILRQLRVSSFGGKMNALNEVNRVITSVSYDNTHNNPSRRPDLPLHHHHTNHHPVASPHNNNNAGLGGKLRPEEDFLSAERMAKWLTENKVLQIVLQDSLHQPQYVEKLEKIIRFKIIEESLSLSDLDDIWDAQVGQHEAIVKNVHELLAKLAWDFSPEQLDHLFTRFQSSLSEANVKQRDKLLELIRRLAEDDKDGDMADKVLNLFWNLSHSMDVSSEIIDQALNAHVKILDYSCMQNRESQKNKWLETCIAELHERSNWVLPALRQIREICCLYSESPSNDPPSLHQGIAYRHDVITRLQKSHVLVIRVANNLTSYISQIAASAGQDPTTLFPDGRYDHVTQVRERLKFLRFLLKDGRLWLCAPQAKQIWECLAERAVFREDREACFEWFSKLMTDVPDLDPDISKGFFVDNILKLEPTLMTEAGITCFDKFFKSVNCKEKKLIIKRRAYLMDNLELIGIEYVWDIIRSSPEENVANRAIDLLEETFTNLGPSLIDSQVDIHEDFISSCMDQLKPIYDTVVLMEPGSPDANLKTRQLIRILKVLHEYISECDADFGEERSFVPLYRAPRGKQLSIVVRFPSQGRQTDDLELLVHSNDTLGSLRRQILQQLKMSSASVKLELFLNGDILGGDEGKILLHTPLSDKSLLTGKVSPLSGHITSSPDSSSDSSASSPHHLYDGGPSLEAEAVLPGVLMAKNPKNKDFLIQLADLGCERNVPLLRDSARHVLQIMPPDFNTVSVLKNFREDLLSGWLGGSPNETLYNLEVIYALLMPGTLSEKNKDFQLNFVKAGALPCFKGILNKRDWLSSADDVLKQLCYISVAKICKFLFCVMGHAFVRAVSEGSLPDPTKKTLVLQKALPQVPSPSTEYRLSQIAHTIGPKLSKLASHNLMDHATVLSIIHLAWASSSGNIGIIASAETDVAALHAPHSQGSLRSLSPDTIILCKEAMEILTLAFALHPQSLETLLKEGTLWRTFIIDMILLSTFKRIRTDAGEQLLLIVTRCAPDDSAHRLLIELLFSVLEGTATKKAAQASEYFGVLSCLLLHASSSRMRLRNAEVLLSVEIAWLKRVRDNVKASGSSGVEDSLLEGHLRITKELIAFLSPEKKFEIGGGDGGLIKDLIEDFIFPASKIMSIYSRTGEIPLESVSPVCSSQGNTLMSAFEVLVSLCTECSKNLKILADMLTDMFYSNGDDVFYEWEYLPPVGPRPSKGFVGLKNAGATCYMNSVLQQLFMIKGVRNGVLTAEGACNDPEEDFSGEDREVDVHPSDSSLEGSSRKDYNITILKQVQAIFAHLSATKLQFYVPKGLWRHFRMQGEPVNLREQQDAVEFFMSLIDFVDEALKALGYEQRMTGVLGGVLSDQMICKTCPHRYSREEPFCVLSVEVRNHNNLGDSLTEYVKGELLDGANAYHCASCDVKVDTIKRLVIKALPPILVIQLKRFDYDYEREAAIKFNDYFEFPRDLDMEPYTVRGLAEREGEVLSSEPGEPQNTNYKLRGMVVHSGQASGGHYYSYIKSRDKWYKFDDGDVTEVKVDDDEELKAQCYGGECLSEVYDQMSKRTSSRKQKRWWNAYMLFYARSDEEEGLTAQLKDMALSQPKIPRPIEKSIQKQNVRFLHLRNQFNVEYFKFMKQLILCNRHLVGGSPLGTEEESIALSTVQLASKFLFQSAFHTKKSLRGSTMDWYDSLHDYLSSSPAVRLWFGNKALFEQPVRFCEYMLECPSVEVRTAFSRIIVCLAHFSLNDGPIPLPSILQQPFIPVEIVGNNLADHLLSTVLSLLWMEVSEHGRHIIQYFSLFSMYASLGIQEKHQLLKLNVPAIFIQVAIDEGPGPPIKYQYVELGKLFQVVSTLIRCCDVSSMCSSRQEEGGDSTHEPPLPNPFAETPNPLMPLQPKVAELLYHRNGYLKKLVEEANFQEDTKKLFQFSCWENPSFSNAILSELLWQITLVVPYELKAYLDLLLNILLLEDSWQRLRIQKALEGIPTENNASRDGLFETISRSNNHCHRRAYHCIKLLASLFSNCRAAKSIFDSSPEIKNKWSIAVVWLSEELDRGKISGPPASFPSAQYSYSNWSPPGQSNENTNGYFLERSHSAKLTLQTAIQLLSEEGIEENEDAEAIPPPSSSSTSVVNNNNNNNSSSIPRGTGESNNSLMEPIKSDPHNRPSHSNNTELSKQPGTDPKMS